ncbi:hypothetical protein C8R44DRAFT_821696, partial [Mycena epipterygia]
AEHALGSTAVDVHICKCIQCNSEKTACCIEISLCKKYCPFALFSFCICQTYHCPS